VRILHVGWGYPPTWLGCGPVVYVHHLALAQKEAGDHVVVACASDQRADGRPAYDPAVAGVDGIPYVHLRNRPVHMHDWWHPEREASDPQCAAAIEHVVREVGPDVVHVHNVVGLSFDVLRVAQRLGSRVVVSLHNYLPICSRDNLFFADAERCEGPMARSCSRCLGTMIGDDAYRARLQAAVDALNGCDRLLAVSARVAELYAAQGVRPELLVVDHIASPAAGRLWDEIGRERVRRAANGAAATPHDPGTKTVPPLRLVFFGALTRHKGVMTLLQAVRHLARPELVDVHIYGWVDQADVPVLQAAIETCSPRHAGRLHFEGPFTQDSLRQSLPSMDVAVLTPRWDDNGPQTVMEALGAGLPVVATRVGGIPDFVHHGENGLLVEEGDAAALAAALDRLASDRHLVEQLRAGIDAPISMATHVESLAGHYRLEPAGLQAQVAAAPG